MDNYSQGFKNGVSAGLKMSLRAIKAEKENGFERIETAIETLEYLLKNIDYLTKGVK